MAGRNNEIALSPWRPLNGIEVLRIPGLQYCDIRQKNKLEIATVNVSTIRDKEEEIIEVMKDKNLGIVNMCETRTSCNIDRAVHEYYRLICTGREDGMHGVGE